MTTLVNAPFLFDNDFGGADAEANSVAPDRAEAMRAAQMERALADARAEGFADGYRSGIAEANTATDRYLACALDALKGELAALCAHLRQREEDFARRSAALAAILCRRLLPSRYAETAVDGIVELVAGFLPRIGETPKVTVRVAEDLVCPLNDQLTEIARDAGFGGRIEIIGDPQMVAGDCRVEWPRGGVARDSAALWREIAALLEETLGDSSADGAASIFVPDNPLKRVSCDA